MNFRKTQPDIKAIESIILSQPQKILLKQTPLYIFPSNENIFKLKIFFSAGSFFQHKPLQAYFTNKMLCEGTTSYTSKRLAEIIDFYGVKLNLTAEEDWASVTLIVSEKNFGNILPVLAEMIFKPAFPEKEFKTQKDIVFQSFIINNEKVATLARNYFMEAIYGSSNYYGYRTKNEDFNTITIEDLKTFHKHYYTFSNAIITLTGKVGPKEEKLLEKYFGAYDEAENGITEKNERSFYASEEMKIHILKNDALQTGIRIGKVLFNRKHPDDLGFRFLNMVLGGYFGSRLMSNIREDKGYTYGIYSSLVSLQHSGYFSIFTEAGKPVCRNAVDEIYKEINRLQQEKISDSELETVRNYMLGNFLRNIDGPLNFSGIYENALLYGYDVGYFYNYIDTIKTFNADTLIDLAGKHLAVDTLHEITVG